MDRCSYPDCEDPVLNAAVPACNAHLCHWCRMGVGMLDVDDEGWYVECVFKRDVFSQPQIRMKL